MTPSDIDTTCEACGGRAPFTGRVDGPPTRAVAICWCPSCRAELRSYRPADADALAAWRAARADADARWEHAWSVLRSGDAPTTRRLLLDLAESGGPLPLVRLTELPFGADLPLTAFLFVVLDHAAFQPAVTDAERLEEALAAGILTDDPAAARAIVARLDRYADDALLRAFQRLPGRIGGGTARALAPLLQALQGRPSRAWAEARWARPGLRAAL